jgi:short subunit dehydrogenase-like uncharacterized protein
MEGETTGKFDIVVYGATGFTGALVAEYLFQSHGDINWAIAGRSQTKLDAIKHQLGAPELASPCCRQRQHGGHDPTRRSKPCDY